MKYFEQYCSHYINKSSNTTESYYAAVKQYYDFASTEYGWNEEEIVKNTTWSQITLFRNSLVRKGHSPFTVNNRISALRSFFRFLMLTHIIPSNPVEEVETVSTTGVEQNKDYLTVEEYTKVLRTIITPTGKKQDKFSFTSKRDAFMVGLMIVGGFRISEVLNMKLNQINKEEKIVTILGKGNKLRTVPLTDSIIKLMEEYLKERNSVNPQDDTLFLNIKGGKLTRQGTNKNIKKYCERAGVNKDITNHSLRHTAITTMIQNGVDVAKVQTIAGHSDSKTTGRYYVSHLQTRDVERQLPELNF